MKMTICDVSASNLHHYQNVYRKRLLTKIESLNAQVLTRSDLEKDQSNQAQLRLNRALKTFIAKGILLKIGHGIYAKAMKMDFGDGKTQVVLRDTFESVAMEALDKLGVEWELSQAIQDYNQGKTTQVPAIFSVKLRSRFRGTISAEGRSLIFEGNVNAA